MSGREHPRDAKLGYRTIHADELIPEDFKLDNLLVENVRWKPSMPDRKGRYLDEIIEMIKDYPKIGIAYDVSHAFINDEPMEKIIEYKDRIKLFHTNDTIGKEDKHLPIGMGEINYKKFFEILAEINYRGFLIIE